jgi:CheY-like chemotaxis protein
MNAEEQEHIFQPFTQADVSTTRKFGGTGLGLCISNELAEKLGGKISCESEKGVGTQFILEVDAGEIARHEMLASRADLQQKDSKKNNTEAHPVLQGRVLLAEDNVDNQRLLGFYLKRAGVTFVIAENGAAAVRFAAEEYFDLVLMDMQMPVMDGLTAIRLLRQQKFNNPIVVLTANVLAEDRDACEKAGANDFLTKPVDVRRLTEVLEKYLPNKPSRTG